MFKGFLLTSLLFFLFLSTGCAHEVVVYRTSLSVPRVQVVKVAPRPRFVWGPGHRACEKRHHGYAMTSGYWIRY